MAIKMFNLLQRKKPFSIYLENGFLKYDETLRLRTLQSLPKCSVTSSARRIL